MNLVESTVMHAIKYSMTKNCFANVILAGPIAAGKRELAHTIAEWLNFVNSVKMVSIFKEEDYYKDVSSIPVNEFGLKDMESKEAFDLEHYYQDAKFFLEREYEYEKIDKDFKVFSEGKVSYLYSISPKRKIKIFTGPHAIELLSSGKIEVPNAISIYIDVSLQELLKRRMDKGFAVPNFPIGSQNWIEYFSYLESQNEKFILPQKEMADIVLKNN